MIWAVTCVTMNIVSRTLRWQLQQNNSLFLYFLSGSSYTVQLLSRKMTVCNNKLAQLINFHPFGPIAGSKQVLYLADFTINQRDALLTDNQLRFRSTCLWAAQLISPLRLLLFRAKVVIKVNIWVWNIPMKADCKQLMNWSVFVFLCGCFQVSNKLKCKHCVCVTCLVAVNTSILHLEWMLASFDKPMKKVSRSVLNGY